MSSSDIELARALSRMLSESPAGGVGASAVATPSAVPPPDPSRFLRFRETRGAAAPPPAPAARAAAPPAAPVPVPVPAPEPEPAPAPEPPGFEAEDVEPLLAGARIAAGARSAFLVDRRGRVVGSDGELGAPAPDPYLARLGPLLDEVRGTTGGSAVEVAVVVEIGESHLTAFPATAPDGSECTVAITGPAPVPRTIRGVLRRTLAGR